MILIWVEPQFVRKFGDVVVADKNCDFSVSAPGDLQYLSKDSSFNGGSYSKADGCITSIHDY